MTDLGVNYYIYISGSSQKEYCFQTSSRQKCQGQCKIIISMFLLVSCFQTSSSTMKALRGSIFNCFLNPFCCTVLSGDNEQKKVYCYKVDILHSTNHQLINCPLLHTFLFQRKRRRKVTESTKTNLQQGGRGVWRTTRKIKVDKS